MMKYVTACLLGLFAAVRSAAGDISISLPVEPTDITAPVSPVTMRDEGVAPSGVPRVVISLDDLPVLYIRIVETPRQVVEPVRDSEEEALLRAVRVVETGDNPRAIGRLGERGSYQFRRATWREITRLPFREAHTPAAHEVARTHLSRLAEGLRSKGLPVDAFHLALAWNAGINGAAARRPPHSAVEYAMRVSALAGDIVHGAF